VSPLQISPPPSILNILSIGNNVQLQTIDKYNKVNPDAIYTIVSLDFEKDQATIRGEDNPLAFTVAAKDLKMPSIPEETSLEDIITEQAEDSSQKEAIVTRDEDQESGEDPKSDVGEGNRIVIEQDFNKGLNLLSTPEEEDESHSGDEDSEIKKIIN